MKKIKVADYIAEFLKNQQVDFVFEVAGGMITHLLDAIYRLQYTRIISVHHEQAAAFAADAFGRMRGRPGVAFATSGPGATNLLTGIASCYFDSSPALFITGQVNVHEQKGERNIRQLGFQETDIVSMCLPVVKKAWKIQTAEEIAETLSQAWSLAISGRPGPVLIDIPMNIQREEITGSPIQYINRESSARSDLRIKMAVVNEYVASAKRPLILLGGGIRSAAAKAACLQYLDKMQIPVVLSLMGLDILPFDHPLRVGFIGTYGNRFANMALSQADLLIVVGSRLDIRQTGADVESFAQNKTIIHIDCDENEINNRIKNCIPIVADARDFFLAALQSANTPFAPPQSWLDLIAALKEKWPDIDELAGCQGINPNQFMHLLSSASRQAFGYLVDVGSHQMWAAQSLELAAHQVFLTSGGMGAMGFALPAAIGAALAADKKPMVIIVGDGALQMNIQEFQTLVRNQIPLKIIVLNNQSLGMIRQFQDNYFEGRHQSTYWGYSAPDFSAIAKAYGMNARKIALVSEMEEAIAWLWEASEKPVLLEVMIHPKVNVYPKIAFGRPIHEMEPFVSPIAMEST